ncbi:hypothetical protein ACFYWN_43335 [Streptomyces sp. NPDC002917]|uniref:hypothetical protein n=1 Tax=Streptomyces sp. NPDC002917 TaxID=3364671 RepID=UPI0036C253A4
MNIDYIIEFAGGLMSGWGPIGMAIVFGVIVWALFIARTLFNLATLTVIGTVRRVSHLWAAITRRTGDETELCPKFEPDYEWMHEQFRIAGVRRHCGYGKGHGGFCGRWQQTSRTDMERILGPEGFAKWAKHVNVERAFSKEEKTGAA